MDTKELLEIATDGEQTEEIKKSPVHFSVAEFVVNYQVQHSQERVTSEFLYYLYRRVYKDGTKYLKLSKIEFCRQLATLFERKRSGAHRYFLVKLTISEKELEQVQVLVKARKDYVREKKQKAIEKKRN